MEKDYKKMWEEIMEILIKYDTQGILVFPIFNKEKVSTNLCALNVTDENVFLIIQELIDNYKDGQLTSVKRLVDLKNPSIDMNEEKK
jgi:hypothetical protein